MMLPRFHNSSKGGFSLVELLVVMLIFGVFMGAVYSVYIAQLKTALNRDEMLEVQQNVRIAMDRVSRDLRMAGFLFPAPVEKTMSNYSTINIQTATADGTFVVIPKVNPGVENSTFTVTPAAALDNFKPNVDKIGLFRPSTRAKITAGGISIFSVLSSSSSSGRITISPAADPDTVVTGDMICKSPDLIRYRVDRTDTALGCNISPCLKRNDEVVAQGIRNIRFEYFLVGDNSAPKQDASDSAVDITKITAIRVVVLGHTGKNPSVNDSTNSRELQSLIKLRNYR